jgi:hypothetical protein
MDWSNFSTEISAQETSAHGMISTRVLSTGNLSTKNNHNLKKFITKLKKDSAAVKNLKKFLLQLHGKRPSLPKPKRF